MGSLKGAVQEIQKAVRERVDGVRHAPQYPPEQPNDFPFVVVYPATGTIEWESRNHRIDRYDMIIELHVSRQDLPTEFAEAVSYAEAIPTALKDAEAAGDFTNIDTYGDMTLTFSAMAWGSAETVGFRWTWLQVTLHQVSS